VALRKKMRLVALILIIIGIVAAFYSGAQRFSIERGAKDTAVFLDWDQVIDIASRNNLSTEEVLQQFSGHIAGIVYSEPTISDLQTEGRALLEKGENMLWEAQKGFYDASKINSSYSYLIFYQEEDKQRAVRHIEAKYPDAYCEDLPYNGDAYIVATSLSANVLSSLGLGFPADNLTAISDAGLAIVPQVRYWDNCNQEGIDAIVSDLQGYNLAAMAFNDSDVPGYDLDAAGFKKVAASWAQACSDLGIPLVTAEFFEQRGMTTMTVAMKQNFIRLHSISEKEMQTLTATKAIDRLTLAASERNMKLLLVRFISKTDIEANIQYLDDISRSLQHKGLTLQVASATPPLQAQKAPLFLISLAVIAGAWLLAQRVHFGRFGDALAILAIICLLGLVFVDRVDMWRKLFALGAVLVFPTLSVIHFTPRKPQSLPMAIGKLLLVTAGSLIGAVLMVGILADGNYMLHLKQFAGVKAAHLLPLLVIAGYFWLFVHKEKRPWDHLRQTLDKPVLVKFLLVAVIIVGVLGIYLMRTGNDNASVSSFEQVFRSTLDHILMVRPRTKEFMLGHPLMLLLFYLGYREKYLPLLILGSIGQVSLVNTFAHIHTPLLVSIMRTVNGLWLGIVIGIILILIVKLIISLWRKYNRQEIDEDEGQVKEEISENI